LGIVKAYTTRVGAGPFVTELMDENGDYLQKKGKEFGATTGRKRRCGWLDLVAVSDAARLNGLDSLAITKLDVLTGLKTLRICVGYQLDGQVIRKRPASLAKFGRCLPVYKDIPGWSEDISGIRHIKDLPSATRQYLDIIEGVTGVPLSIVSVGAAREDTIVIKDPFAVG
jgi:adenylosuccinate synthase